MSNAETGFCFETEAAEVPTVFSFCAEIGDEQCPWFTSRELTLTPQTSGAVYFEMTQLAEINDRHQGVHAHFKEEPVV